MNILVTGANGFVGSRLMWFLEEKGHKVFGIDKRSYCLINKHHNTILGDIRKKEDLEKFSSRNIDLIIHCAASKHDFGISEEEYFSDNEYGTKVLMEFASEASINKIIYYSTVSVYGHKSVPCDESGKLQPDNPYGASKLAGEFVISNWQTHNPRQRQVVILRPSIIYGPHNFANMYNLIEMMHKRPWISIGKGDHIKSMVSLNNLLDMTYFMMQQLKPGIEYVNTLDKPYISVKKLMEIIASNNDFKEPLIRIPETFALMVGKIFDLVSLIIGKEIPINSDRMEKFSTSTHYFSEKIRNLGYEQRYTVEEEMGKTVDWFLAAHQDRQKMDPAYR